MIPNRPLRVIIDTNLWISFIIPDKVNQLELLLYSQEIRLLFCKKLISQIGRTIEKPKLKKYSQKVGLEEMLTAFHRFIELIDISSQVRICRDPNDGFLLDLAIDGKADCFDYGR